MNILVTGGSGFLGSHVADQLSNIGHKVTIYDKKKSNWLRTDQKMIIGNILDSSKLEIGDSVRVHDLKLPEKVSHGSDENYAVVSIVGRVKEEVEESATEESEEETKEEMKEETKEEESSQEETKEEK